MMMTPEQLLSRLDQGSSLPPVILCCGEEPQRTLTSVDAIKHSSKTVGFLEQQLMVVEQIGRASCRARVYISVVAV